MKVFPWSDGRGHERRCKALRKKRFPWSKGMQGVFAARCEVEDW